MQIDHAYYLIVDLEATCSDDGSVPRHEMEIIEIGAVMLGARLFEIESEFQTFVRPVRNPLLTEFCRDLTGIDQTDVDPAPGFAEAISAMRDWMDEFDDTLFCSWGDYDRKQFQRDCQWHGVPYPFRSGHRNLKVAFSQYFGVKRKFGLDDAIRHLGLRFEGSHHRGIDDARNIARIVQRVCVGG